MPLRSAAGGSSSRDAAEDAGCPLLEAASPLLEALGDSDSVICSMSRSALSRLLDIVLPHPVLEGIRSRKQVTTERTPPASIHPSTNPSVYSSTHPSINQSMHPSIYTSLPSSTHSYVHPSIPPIHPPNLYHVLMPHQVRPSRASCLAKAVQSLRSSLLPKLRDNAHHQSPLTRQRLPALQYLLPAQIATR